MDLLVFLFVCLTGESLGQFYQLRLTNSWYGRVEVSYGGTIGTVCDDYWDDNDCRVVCRQIGFSGGIARGSAFYGQGSGPIWLDDVYCCGKELSLQHCRHLGWGIHNCAHLEDAGCECNPMPSDSTCPLGWNPVTIYGELNKNITLYCQVPHYFQGTINQVTWRNGTNDVIVSHFIGRDPDIFFNKTSNNMNNYIYDKYNFSITVTELTNADVDCYRCEAKNSKSQSHTSDARIAISVPPNEVYLYENVGMNGHENQSSTITCVIPSLYPAIGYITFTIIIGDHVIITSSDGDLVNGRECSNTTLSVIYTTSIAMHKTFNGFNLTCGVNWMNDTNLQSNETTLNVTFQTTDLIITDQPKDFVVEGTTISITCESGEGNPTPVIYWYEKHYLLHYQALRSIDSTIVNTEVDGEFNAKRIISTVRMQVSRYQQGRSYACGLQHTSSIKRDFQLNVAYPPNVTINATPSNKVNESDSLHLNCSAYNGNPSVYNYKWMMASSRYNTSQQNKIVQLGTQSVLVIGNLQLQSVGVYSCEVTNAGGSSSDDIEVLLMYIPKDISRPNQKVSFSGVNEIAWLNCTVLSYPEIGLSNVTITHRTKPVIGYKVQPSQGHVDEYVIEIKISPVGPKDYGIYDVYVDNNIGITHLTLELKDRGPPESPTDIQVDQVTAHTASLSWIAGRSGGYIQTFQIYYKPSPNAANMMSPPIADPGVGTRGKYTLSELTDNTLYYIKVISTNGNTNGVNTAATDQSTVLTLSVPNLMNIRELQISGNTVTLRWDNVQGYHTKKVIVKCTKNNQNCQILAEITDLSKTSIKIIVENPSDYIFVIKLYQHHDMVKSYQLSSPEPEFQESGSNIGIIAGAIAGALVLLIIVLLVIVAVRCRHKFQMDPKPRTRSTKVLTDSDEVYDNIDQSPGTEMYESVQHSKPPDSTQIYTGLTTTSRDKMLLPRVPVTKLTKSDIKIGIIISQGHFSILRKGLLKKNISSVREVAVKLPKEKLSLAEVQIFCYQIHVLEKLSNHTNIIDMISFNADVITGELMLVSKYYKNHDLRTYLIELEKGEYYNMGDEKLYQKMATDVAKGMSFLQTQQPKILHSELSAAHVLVDDEQTCKITGFGYSKAIIAKEQKEIEDKVPRYLQWKAPECFTDPTMHGLQSDVWSFGVLLHEIYSMGLLPYKGKTDSDIIKYVKEGSRLPCPTRCPDNIYSLMIQCWAYNPPERPSFDNILSCLENPDTTTSYGDSSELYLVVQ